MKKIYLFLLVLFCVCTRYKSFAQTTIVSEDFENSVTLFSNSGGSFYSSNSASGDRPATSPFAISNTYALGVSNGTAILTSIGINTSNYNTVELALRLATFSIGSTANGADGTDIVKIEISPDGGANYYPTLQVAGNSNAYWAYSTGTAIASTAYDGDATLMNLAPAAGGNRTTDGYSTMTIAGLPSVSDLRVKITLTNNAASERWVIDDFKITGISASATPTKLAITSISPSSPIINNGFSVTVQAQDNSNNPQNVSSGTTVNLSVVSGTGILSGSVSGIINSGTSSVIIPGVTYNVAESGVVLTATATAGMLLAAGNSASFNVLAIASQLAFVGVPSTGTANANLSAFTVEARRPDNTVDNSYTGTITVTKASGAGTLSGTTSVAAVNGIANFNNLQFDQSGTYTLSTSASGLTGQTSGSIVIAAIQSFASGNLIVYRVGDGSAPLTAAATAAYLDEYTPAGILVQSIPLPTVVSGSNNRITAAGTTTSEGMITRSADKQYIMVTGYDAALGTASVASSSAASVNRVVGRVSVNTSIDATTALADVASGTTARGVASTSGTDIWISTSTGIYYASLGATTSTSLTSNNSRVAQIFNGQLYGTSASASLRLFTVGTGTPTTTGQTLTNLPSYPVVGSPYGYFFADLDAGVAGLDVLYVADDGSNTGLQKYSLVGGNWVSNGNVAVTGNGLRGLTGVVNGTTVTLYATNSATSSNLISFVDNTGYNSVLTATPAILATATTNTAFRGIALSPEAINPGPLPVRFSMFRAYQKTNGIQLKWTNETEEDLKSYVVERSTDSRNFTTIGEVLPLKNDHSKMSYTWLDTKPSNGSNYYRIKAIEISGKEVYTTIVKININTQGTELIVYPNPVSGSEMNIQISNLPGGSYVMQLFNSSGQELMNRSIEHVGGSLTETFPVSRLQKGIYSLLIVGRTQLKQQLMIE